MKTTKADNSFMTTLPKGAIIMWSGTLSELDKLNNWVICNGDYNTPDLRNRFIVGAGSHYQVSETGGENQVTLSVSEMPNHSHNINSGKTCSGTGCSSKHDIYSASQSGSHNGTTYTGGNKPHENRPPFFALYYIMKIKS